MLLKQPHSGVSARCQARQQHTLRLLHQGHRCRRAAIPAAAQPTHLADLAAASYEASRNPTGSRYSAQAQQQAAYEQQQAQYDQGQQYQQQQNDGQYGAQYEGQYDQQQSYDQQQNYDQQQSYDQQQQYGQGYAEGQDGQAGSEAVIHAAAAAAAQQAEDEDMVMQEVTTETEVYDKSLTLRGMAEDTYSWVRTTNPGRAAAVTVAAVLVGTFGMALYRYYQKYQSTRNVRKRQVARNKTLVAEISKILPDQRGKLNAAFITGLRLRTGFSNVEIFRKYLWYLLRERKFDQAAVEDLVALKHAAGLKDDDVAEALKERSQRTYDKYGTLMLNTEGMTEAGIQRKATCQALFRKLLYLCENEQLVKQGTPAAESVDLRTIFGATSEDMARLRIVSLYENDIDLERALTVSIDDDDEGSSSSSQAATKL